MLVWVWGFFGVDRLRICNIDKKLRWDIEQVYLILNINKGVMWVKVGVFESFCCPVTIFKINMVFDTQIVHFIRPTDNFKDQDSLFKL